MSTAKKMFSIVFFVVICLFSQINASGLSLSSSDSTCCDDNSIFVSGYGKVTVTPDLAYITIKVSVLAKTSQLASQGVSNRVLKLNKILA